MSPKSRVPITLDVAVALAIKPVDQLIELGARHDSFM